MNKLEIACFNLESAIVAQENGADRIELCDEIAVGGTTPKALDIINTRKLVAIDLYLMIRPRGGNFVYSDEEFSQMKLDILHSKSLKVNGFVFGILNQNNEIDVERNTELVALAKPFPCTFHRAFDEVSDALKSLEEIIECGFQTILTSGQAQNAVEGINQLTELVEKAGNRIVIMPGGGMRSDNIDLINQETKANWFHSSAIIDDSDLADGLEIQLLKLILNK
ncbi:copper homeostasis protein CutC [Flavobacterium sp.]|uniref:copper homeostasis protein CutC n=1 Tax=Flavobacterium sp. TaxID=239 RepID=UPI0037536A8A